MNCHDRAAMQEWNERTAPALQKILCDSAPREKPIPTITFSQHGAEWNEHSARSRCEKGGRTHQELLRRRAVGDWQKGP